MEPRRLGAAALLGVAAGMPSMAPLAVLGPAAPRGQLVGARLGLASAGELLNDMWPGAGERTAPALRLLEHDP